MDIEKAFDRAPQKVIWWGKLGVEETTDSIFVVRQQHEKYHGHREGVPQSSSESDLVDNEKARC